jgi:hypothetical protein
VRELRGDILASALAMAGALEVRMEDKKVAAIQDPESAVGSNVVTPWQEDPLRTVWREVGEDRYVTLDSIQSTFMGDAAPGRSLGEILVGRRCR